MSTSSYCTGEVFTSESPNWLHSEEYEDFCNTFLDKMKDAKLDVSEKHHYIELNIDEDNKILFCPKYIANLRNGGMDKVKEPASRILYNSQEFKDGIEDCITNKKAGKLLWAIKKYAILNDKINEIFTFVNTQYNSNNNLGKQKEIENEIENVVKKMEPIDILHSLMDNVKEKKNCVSEISLKHNEKECNLNSCKL